MEVNIKVRSAIEILENRITNKVSIELPLKEGKERPPKTISLHGVVAGLDIVHLIKWLLYWAAAFWRKNQDLPALASTYLGADSSSGGQANSSMVRVENGLPFNLGIGDAQTGSLEWGTLAFTSHSFKGLKRQLQIHGFPANSIPCKSEKKKHLMRELSQHNSVEGPEKNMAFFYGTATTTRS